MPTNTLPTNTMPTNAAVASVASTAPGRKAALVAGVFYLVTFVSIPALLLLGPALEADYILGSGQDTRVLLGGLLETVTALACIGTAVVLYPILRRQNEALALGFVTARVFEAALIMVGVVSVLTLVTLRQEAGGAAAADPGALLATGKALVGVKDWTFLLGPGIVPAINALLLGTLLYRSRLVPRVLPVIGMVGAPLLLISSVATLFGANEQISALSAAAGLPMAVWELSLGLYLVFRGFKPTTVGSSEHPLVPERAPLTAP